MEELLELRQLVVAGKVEAALSLIEKRTTHSWDVSIRNAIAAISRTNKRRKAGGYYLSRTELEEILAEAYDQALDNAALEAFGGIYQAIALGAMVDRASILEQALALI